MLSYNLKVELRKTTKSKLRQAPSRNVNRVSPEANWPIVQRKASLKSTFFR